MKIIPFGENGVLVKFEQKISAETNHKVVELQRQLEEAYFPEITFVIPAFCSLTIGFSPYKTTFPKLKNRILELKKTEKNLSVENSVLHKIPVCYHHSYSIDLQEVTNQTTLSKKEIIQLHTEQIFQIYMMGFLPGFAYLGPVPKALFTKRKKVPRKRVESGSIGLAGLQTGIYPMASPGGWQIIGRTPVEVFNHKKEQPFLFKTGDRVQFHSISVEEFENYEN